MSETRGSRPLGGVDRFDLIEEFVRGTCGASLDTLVFEMRDHALPPIQLPPHVTAAIGVADAYSECEELIGAELAQSAYTDVEALRNSLPWHLADDPELVAALLQTATSQPYFALDSAVYTARETAARLYQAYPELLADTDSDGLLRVARYDTHPQAVLHSGSALIYHPFLRRNFTGSVNDSLIRTLLEVARGDVATLRLALNEQHFMPATAFSEYFEHDFWFGPPLSPDAIDDPHKLGLTVHGDPRTGPGHEHPRLFVNWSRDKDGNKVVQIEELSDQPSTDPAGMRLLRYLHAIRDTRRKCFIHCDGAVRAYTTEQYELRSAKQLVTGRESATRYRKVFRLDGVIETDAWSNIAARWFRGNSLMGEYLQGIASNSAHLTAGSSPIGEVDLRR